MTVPGRCSRRRCRPRSPPTSTPTAVRSTRRATGWWCVTATTQPREVTTAAGAVPVRAPRVNDKRVDPETGERQRFSSAILPAWARKSPQVGEVLPLLYLHGLSSGDFGPALEQFLGSAPGLSAATITRLTAPVAGRGRGVRHGLVDRHRLRVSVGRRDRAPRGAV